MGEGTFAGTRGNEEDAPKPVVRGTAIEPPKSPAELSFGGPRTT
jgi:hypothetical protein